VSRVILAMTVGLLFTSLVGANLPSGQAESSDTIDAEPRPNGTVVATQRGQLLAYRPNGSLWYQDTTHHGYWDVDPISANGSATDDQRVIYTATDPLESAPNCEANGRLSDCLRQSIEVANLNTGETRTLLTRTVPQDRATEWHDVDRLNDTHPIVADMYADRVFVVNHRTGIITWQ